MSVDDGEALLRACTWAHQHLKGIWDVAYPKVLHVGGVYHVPKVELLTIADMRRPLHRYLLRKSHRNDGKQE